MMKMREQKTTVNWRDKRPDPVRLKDGSLKTGMIFCCAILLTLCAGTLAAQSVAAAIKLQRSIHSGARVRVAALLPGNAGAGHDSFTLVSVNPTSAAGGAVTRRGKWIFYKAPADFTNSDSFRYVIADGNGLQTTGSVTIAVGNDLAPSQNIAATERLGGNASHVHFMGIPGRTYTIQYTENLQAPHWRTLGTKAADATGQFDFTDTPPPGSAARFYRSTSL